MSVAWSPDGSKLTSASLDKTVRIWDAATGKRTATLKGHSDIMLSVAWSPNGKKLATASADQSLRIWVVPGEQQFQ